MLFSALLLAGSIPYTPAAADITLVEDGACRVAMQDMGLGVAAGGHQVVVAPHRQNPQGAVAALGLDP